MCLYAALKDKINSNNILWQNLNMNLVAKMRDPTISTNTLRLSASEAV